MDEVEKKLKELELERSHQNSIEIKRGTKNVMTYTTKIYFTDLEQDKVIERLNKTKSELDKLCEIEVVQ